MFTALASDLPKYKTGDCITSIDKNYSWFDYVARVEAVSKIDDLTSNKSYILLFPKYRSTTVIFSRNIEFKTAKVDMVLCEM